MIQGEIFDIVVVDGQPQHEDIDIVEVAVSTRAVVVVRPALFANKALAEPADIIA